MSLWIAEEKSPCFRFRLLGYKAVGAFAEKTVPVAEPIDKIAGPVALDTTGAAGREAPRMEFVAPGFGDCFSFQSVEELISPPVGFPGAPAVEPSEPGTDSKH